MQFHFVFKNALVQIACHTNKEGEASAGYDVCVIEALVHRRNFKLSTVIIFGETDRDKDEMRVLRLPALRFGRSG